MKLNLNNIQGLYAVAKLVILLIIVFKVIGFLNGSGKDIFNSAPRDTIYHSVTDSVEHIRLVENNKDLKQLIKVLSNNNSKALEQIKQLDQTVSEIGIINTALKSKVEELENDIYTDKDKTKSYDTVTLFRDDAEGDKYPIGNVFYSFGLKEDQSRWTSQLFKLDLYTNIVMSEREDGTYDKVIESYIESNFIKDYAGIKYPIDIKKISWAKRKIKTKKFRWNPNLNLGLTAGSELISPIIGISLFSYGRTEIDNDFLFLNVYTGGNTNSATLGVSPIQYNIGNHLPLINNTFIGPSIGLSNDGTVYGVNLSVPF